MEFQHFAHNHKLKFMEVAKENEHHIWCWGCLDIIYGPAYVCEEEDNNNDFAMHKSCAELPPQIQKDTFHSHPLRFQMMDLIVCDACRKLSGNVISYRCTCCEFKVDFKCAMAAILNHETAKHDDRGGTAIHHFSHPHQLTRCEFSLKNSTELEIQFFEGLWGTRKLKCVACKQEPQETLIYICLACKFVIHESCMNEMPRQVERTLFHPHHTLLPRPFLQDASVRCYACDRKVKGFSFYCYKCDVDLHVSCAKYRTRAVKHHSHPHHLLQLGQSCTSKRSACHACHSKDCNIDSIFSCRKCDFNVHSRCIPLELPSSIEHQRHMHPLVLTSSVVEDDSGNYYCDMCETERNPELQVYYCQECNYIAHIDCVLSKVLEPMNEMLLDPRKMEENYDKMDLDSLALEGSEVIQRDALHPHPLTLDESKNTFVCDGCEELCSGSSYSCKLCSFKLDNRCASLDDGTQTVKKIKKTVIHFSHSHQLTRCKINILQSHQEFHMCCRACRQRLCGIIYACIHCGFFLHESCLEDMLMEVQSLFHTQHPLLLQSSLFDDLHCEACGEETGGLPFVCLKCNIFMHYSCAKYQFRELNHDSHVDHDLLHLGKAFFGDASPRCNSCGQACKNTLFCCFKCGFYIHLECIPLPSVVKHKRHLHPLVLTTSVIEDDSGQYYCDICETQRNPEHDVYHCQECNFISHIDCVLSEVQPPEEILQPLTPRPRASWLQDDI